MSHSEPEDWLEEHGSALYSFAYLHVRDTHRAEDLVQETLLAALKGRERFQGNASVRTWLTGSRRTSSIIQLRRPDPIPTIPYSVQA
jgi:RNA polymerase sigma-70 factor (ECF subfamily)